QFMTEAKARGCMLLLVDMPDTLPETQADQIKQRAFPYLVAISPEQVTHYELDERGRLTTVSIADTGTNAKGEDITITRTWNTESWEVKHGEDVVKSGDHGLGVTPVLIFSESGAFPSEGAFSPIADLAKRLYNMLSELDELLRSQ